MKFREVKKINIGCRLELRDSIHDVKKLKNKIIVVTPSSQTSDDTAAF